MNLPWVPGNPEGPGGPIGPGNPAKRDDINKPQDLVLWIDCKKSKGENLCDVANSIKCYLNPNGARN